MSRAGWKTFSAIQLVGILAAFGLALSGVSRLGPTLWVIASIALLPGDLLGGWLVEKALWGGPLGLRTLAVLSILCAVAINGLLWLSLTKVWRLFRGRASAAT